MKSKRHKAQAGNSDAAPAAAADELPERWSVQRKTELVLRLVRGESSISSVNVAPRGTLRRAAAFGWSA
jgi:hypothetical protein